MRVSIVSPNYALREEFGDPTDPPIGIASIASVLEKKGYNVEVIDANVENLTIDEIRARIIKFVPDVVGISCNYSPLHNPTIKVSEMVKKELGVPVVIGGNHATALAGYMLERNPDIDIVVRGEGEVVLPELLNTLENGLRLDGVKGISYRAESGIVDNEDAPLMSSLDELPLPAYHLLPMEKYGRYNILASRGCPYECSYCASKVIFRRRVRHRSPKLVLDEVTYLLERYGNKHFWFSDDTFISNPKYTIALLDELKKRKLDITWSCLTRVNIVTKDLLIKMKESGCKYISYGIESGSEEILEKIGKKITKKQIIDTLNMTHEVGIRQYGFFIVGFPGENKKTIMDSYKLIYQSKLDGAAFNILIPLPGTRLMNELLHKNLLSIDEIKWDYLFARTPKQRYEYYSAEIAARWTEVLPDDLIGACLIGQRLPEIFKYIRSGEA